MNFPSQVLPEPGFFILSSHPTTQPVARPGIYLGEQANRT
jgi:hypothetical protein